MGANKTKINKNVLNQLVSRTHRSPAEIKAMYAIFLRHFPSGRIESPQDLWRCFQKFSPIPTGRTDPKAVERLYRLFDAQNRNPRHDGSIDFFHFMIVSNILERGAPSQKIALYFESLDVNNDRVITRDDLEACLPPTVESRQLIQQLLKQWDMNKDGVVSMEDFERYIMSNPDLLPMFADSKDRVRIDSVTIPASSETYQITNSINANRGLFVTSQ